MKNAQKEALKDTQKEALKKGPINPDPLLKLPIKNKALKPNKKTKSTVEDRREKHMRYKKMQHKSRVGKRWKKGIDIGGVKCVEKKS